LDVPVFVVRAVCHLTEKNIESYILAGIGVEIKTKGVKTLFPKSVRAADPGIWIDGQGHRYRPRRSAEEIKVAEIDSRILPSGWCIEMVGHIRLSSVKSNCVHYFVESNPKSLQRISSKRECNLVRHKKANAVFCEQLYGFIKVYRCIGNPIIWREIQALRWIAIVALAFIKPPGVISTSM
jgi:hypothetical protein